MKYKKIDKNITYIKIILNIILSTLSFNYIIDIFIEFYKIIFLIYFQL